MGDGNSGDSFLSLFGSLCGGGLRLILPDRIRRSSPRDGSLGCARWRVNECSSHPFHLVRREIWKRQAAFLPPLAHLVLGGFGPPGVQSFIASVIKGPRRKGETGPAFFDDVHDPQEHVFPDSEEFPPVARRRIREYLNVQRAEPEPDEPRAPGRGKCVDGLGASPGYGRANTAVARGWFRSGH